MANGFNNTPPFIQNATDNALGGNIGGILSTRPVAKYLSGARTVLRVNGKIVGFSFGISWRITTAYREINAIDNPLPEEFVPQKIKVEGSISALHIPGQGAGVQLWQPDAIGFLFHQYITIEVRDSQTDQLLFYAPKAVITTRQEEIKVDQLASVTLNFMSIGFRDEKDPTYPADFDHASKASDSEKTTGIKLLKSAEDLASSFVKKVTDIF